MQRQDEKDVLLLPGGEIEVVLERARGIAEVVEHLRGLGQRARAQEVGDAAVLEARGAEAVGAAQRDHRPLAVDAHPAIGIAQLLHRDRAPALAQRLPGRVDPERPQREEQPALELPGRLVADPVAQPERRAAGRAGGQRRDLEPRPGLGRGPGPGHARHRQVALLELLDRHHVAPADEAVVEIEERLDRAPALAGLDPAGLVDQRLLEVALDAGHRPIALLVGVVAGIGAARRVLGDGGEEGVGRAGKLVGLDVDALDRVAGAARAALQVEPQIAGIGLGQIEVVATAVAGLDPESVLPFALVVRDLDVVGRGKVLVAPVDHQAAILAHLLEVDQQPLLLGDRAAVPAGRRVAVEDRRGRAALGAGRRLEVRRQIVGPEVALGEAQLVDPHRPRPAAAGGDRELDLGDLLQLAAVRPPGELDVALLHRHLAPALRELEMAQRGPPHVLARGVDELDLEIVLGRIPTDVERERVVVRQRPVGLLARDQVAGVALEVEVEPHRHAAPALVLSELDVDALRGAGRPGAQVLEVVEQRRPRAERSGEQRDDAGESSPMRRRSSVRDESGIEAVDPASRGNPHLQTHRCGQDAAVTPDPSMNDLTPDPDPIASDFCAGRYQNGAGNARMHQPPRNKPRPTVAAAHYSRTLLRDWPRRTRDAS